jgi:hypothetical protein
MNDLIPVAGCSISRLSTPLYEGRDNQMNLEEFERVSI